MKWQRGYQSKDVEDRRGTRRRRGGPALKLGVGGTLIGLVVLVAFGKDYLGVLSAVGPSAGPAAPAASSPEQKEQVEFISFALDDIQNTWEPIFRKRGQNYQRAKLVLFNDSVSSACGEQSSAVGPFYCGGDKKAYIDLTFYGDLKKRFGAPGDFAQAYVLAHEIGHHVQNLLGISRSVARLKRASPAKKNALSVRQELQADCFAGVWAHSTRKRKLLEAGDVDEALTAASAIGDDTLQRRARGKVSPETFTHGTAEQRKRWFKVGMDSGSVDACDTLKADTL